MIVLACARLAGAEKGSPRGEVDLLRSEKGVVIAVSSAVSNPRIHPRQLVDGALDTAWNGRSGDLAGAWVAVRLPGPRRVSAVELTAGFASNKGKRDLFLGNYRIKRLRVVADGRPVGELTLDIEQRGLQRLPVKGTAREWRFEIVEVVAGTERRWREICVSELRLLGALAAGALDRAVPEFRVGSLDGRPPCPMGTRFKRQKEDSGEREEWCERPSGEKHGYYGRYRADGRPEELGGYEKDQKAGTWTTYDKDTGEESEVCDYDADEKHGWCTTHGVHGEETQRGRYVRGDKDGWWREGCTHHADPENKCTDVLYRRGAKRKTVRCTPGSCPSEASN
ncbi:MAG: hypothetical protein IT371_14200 [Deltaproteobacteria bacterium]|nr:hypothetical protein [Deltaproteobacteria bacterium]